MNSKVISWLLEEENPAVAYRTQTEILSETADPEPVRMQLAKLLPENWTETKGLWLIYHITAIAESGLTAAEFPEVFKVEFDENKFECGCGDFMRLHAMVRLGLDIPMRIFDAIAQNQLPDGGFLCLHRLKKLKYTPKSCYKANLHALMFFAECKKHGISLQGTDSLLDYFWKHNIFYRTVEPETLVLNAREGWRSIDTFHPFETMRVGLHNIVEAFCALGYGNDARLTEAWDLLYHRKTSDGKYLLNQTLAKSYLPKEKVGKPSKWVTFYAELAEQLH